MAIPPSTSATTLLTPSSKGRPPGPAGLFPLREFSSWQRNPITYFEGLANRFGDVSRVRFGPIIAVVVRDPELVREVLQKRHKEFDKQSRGYNVIRSVFGNGLLTSEGDFWLRQRRIAQPSFHPRRIASFADVMVDEFEGLAKRWQDATETDTADIDTGEAMRRVTLQIVTKTVLGSELSTSPEELGQAIEVLQRRLRYQVSHPVMGLPWMPGKLKAEAQQAQTLLDGEIQRLIEVRRKAPGKFNDLLGLLMDARDEETGEQMTDRQLRDEALTMFLAGHDTTAHTLSWALYLLATHPEVAEKVRAEAGSVAEPGLSADSYKLLPYTRDVVQETLRLYPPAWIVARRAAQATTLGGFQIDKGANVLVPPYLLHRHPELWERPTAFWPERFASKEVADLPKFAYMPFGGGPHICIGKGFALMEAVLALAALVPRFDFSWRGTVPIEPEAVITLRPKGGVALQIRQR